MSHEASQLTNSRDPQPLKNKLQALLSKVSGLGDEDDPMAFTRRILSPDLPLAMEMGRALQNMDTSM